MVELKEMKSEISLLKAQVNLDRKRLKEKCRQLVLLDYRMDLERDYEKHVCPIISRYIDCINELLDRKANNL